MCQDNSEENRRDNDYELFNKLKKRLLDMSDEYSDDAGVRLFKSKLEQATSFSDFNK